MRTIHRYQLDWMPGLECEVQMRTGAKLLSFSYQAGRREFQVWAEVDDHAGLELRKFHLLATGAYVEDGLVHVGTTVMPDGFHVFHLYEERLGRG